MKSNNSWKNLKWMYKLPIMLGAGSLITTAMFLNCYDGGCSNMFLILLYFVSPSIIIWDLLNSNMYLSQSLETLIIYFTNVVFFAIIGLVFGWLIDINKKH